MNRDQFISLIQSPGNISANTADELQKVIEQFPYCQTAHLLYTNTLHKTSSIHYQSSLKKTSAYASDRQMVYQLVMQQVLTDTIEEYESPVLETSTSEQQVSKKSDISFLEKEILKEAISASVSRDLTHKKQHKSASSEKVPEQADQQKPDIHALKKEGEYSFNEWLQVLSGEQPQEDIQQPNDLIDKFLEKDSQIKPTKTEFFSPTNMAKLSLLEDASFVTETLAKIYEQQEDYERAIKAYRNLSLKNPKKSTYFAARIKEIEKKANEK